MQFLNLSNALYSLDLENILLCCVYKFGCYFVLPSFPKKKLNFDLNFLSTPTLLLDICSNTES